LTRFLGSQHDALSVSYHVRFPAEWRGGTKLVGIYGSRPDEPWAAFGKAGTCPSGSDFFATMLVTAPPGDPGPLRFYTYYPQMTRETDGATCWGRHGNGSETYTNPTAALERGRWHHLEFDVALNTPAGTDARQMFWIDGVPQGRWGGFSFGDTAALKMNAVQLSFSVTGGVSRDQTLHVDNVVVRRSSERDW
jgi:hypothetical protein